MKKIIINTKEYFTDKEVLSYEDVLSLAQKPLRNYSMTYRLKIAKDIEKSGILHHGESVDIADGMVFNAFVTGNA